MQRVFVADARDRLLLEEVPRVFVGQPVRLPRRFFDRRAFEKQAHVRLLPVQLTGREAKAFDALGFGEERRHAALDAVVRDQRHQRRGFRWTDEPRAIGLGGEERRIGRVRELVETIRQHAGEQPLHQALPVGADRRLVALGHRAHHVDDR